jgi:hypothetical protein
MRLVPWWCVPARPRVGCMRILAAPDCASCQVAAVGGGTPLSPDGSLIRAVKILPDGGLPSGEA